MTFILTIETTTKNCSVALFKDQELIKLKEEVSEKYTHAEKLTLFIKEVIGFSKINLQDIGAVAISKGPGSYTGLRIGTAIAKGLCYALEIPLISVSTLKAMAFSMSEAGDYAFFCPMIDARRMEVFSAIYDKNFLELREVKSDVITQESYKELLKKGKILFFGNNILRFKEIIDDNNAYFIDKVFPSAANLGILAYDIFKSNNFEDVAYFEPYYLKDFIIGKKS
tara:strand:- start:5175 stop:5849 length:675 start_codon:yes stop_codon:yes gene_type:complete